MSVAPPRKLLGLVAPRKLLSADATWSWARVDTIDRDQSSTAPSTPDWAKPSLSTGTKMGDDTAMGDEGTTDDAISADEASVANNA